MQKGADATLKDYKGRTAFNLALPSRRNTSERERRMVMYREPPEAHTHRRHIAFMLKAVTGEEDPVPHPNPDHRRSTRGIFLDPIASSQSGYIEYSGLEKLYPIPDVRKAIGPWPVVSHYQRYERI